MKLAIIFPKDSEAIFNTNSSATFGGATVQLYQLAKELNSYNTITTISLIPNINEINFKDRNRFNLIQIYYRNDNFIIKIIKLLRFIKKEKPDYIIQRGLTIFSCLLATYCNIKKINYVYMFAHDIESNGIYQNSKKKCYLFNFLLKNSRLLIVQNELQKNNISNHNNTIKTPVKILKKGISKAGILPKNNIKFSAIWIARCEPWKNIELFIDLAKHYPAHTFLAISPMANGQHNYFTTIKSKCEKTKNLKFLDFVDNTMIYRYLSQSKVFVITSESEGDWPMTVLEAAATGVPVLSLSLNYGDLISQYKGGIYCNGNNATFLQSFSQFFSDKNKYNEMGANAKKYIDQYHNIKRNTKLFISYLKKVY